MNNQPPPLPGGPPALPPQPQPELPKRRGMPLIAKISLLIAVVVASFIAFRVVQFAKYMKEHPRHAVPGELEFREANRQIIGNKGTVSFGNNGEAVSLASDYSKSLKILREGFFTEGKKNAFSISKGEFLTYCQWNGDSCAFLVHVPEFRRFTSDAKKSLTDLAWMNAQSVLAASKQPPPKTIAVGVKGAVLYETVLIGNFVSDPQKGDGIITQRASGISGTALLYPFFAVKDKSTKPTEQ